MKMRLALALMLVACGGGKPALTPTEVKLAERFPLAKLDNRALCDQLLARGEAFHVAVDPEPLLRRKVIVSDLHLGPGVTDKRFSGIEDFYAETEWRAFLERHGRRGPDRSDHRRRLHRVLADRRRAARAAKTRSERTSGHAGARRRSDVQPPGHAAGDRRPPRCLPCDRRARSRGTITASSSSPAITMRTCYGRRCKLGIAKAIAPSIRAPDVRRRSGVRTPRRARQHGHAYDAANKFANKHAPFARASDGRCRLQSFVGEVFVDAFYAEPSARSRSSTTSTPSRPRSCGR